MTTWLTGLTWREATGWAAACLLWWVVPSAAVWGLLWVFGLLGAALFGAVRDTSPGESRLVGAAGVASVYVFKTPVVGWLVFEVGGRVLDASVSAWRRYDPMRTTLYAVREIVPSSHAEFSAWTPASLLYDGEPHRAPSNLSQALELYAETADKNWQTKSLISVSATDTARELARTWRQSRGLARRGGLWQRCIGIVPERDIVVAYSVRGTHHSLPRAFVAILRKGQACLFPPHPMQDYWQDTSRIALTQCVWSSKNPAMFQSATDRMLLTARQCAGPKQTLFCMWKRPGEDPPLGPKEDSNQEDEKEAPKDDKAQKQDSKDSTRNGVLHQPSKAHVWEPEELLRVFSQVFAPPTLTRAATPAATPAATTPSAPALGGSAPGSVPAAQSRSAARTAARLAAAAAQIGKSATWSASSSIANADGKINAGRATPPVLIVTSPSRTISVPFPLPLSTHPPVPI